LAWILIPSTALRTPAAAMHRIKTERIKCFIRNIDEPFNNSHQ